MTDNTELKRLAEALIAATDVYMADECNDYLATNWAAADDAYQQATLPETVLALISENERLKNRLEVDPRHDYDGISTRDATVKVLDEQVDQLKADNERLEVEVKRMTSIAYAAHGAFRMETMAERDQLRAEVAGLRTGYEAYERVNAELKAENERLRAALDSCAEELAAEVICKHGGQKLEDMHPVTRRLYERDMAPVVEARAALGQGEQS